MIRDLSTTLRAVLEGSTPKFTELGLAQIVFDRPDEKFTPNQTSVDLFLYDIRENLQLRNNEPIVERNNGEAVIRQPPCRIDCSYLVTAFPIGGTELPLQEHRLLAQGLRVLARHPTIPSEFLKGDLVGQVPPLPLVAPQVDGLKNPAEFWSAMSTQLRPSFSVKATISVPVFPDATSYLVTATDTGIDPGSGTVEETFLAVGGRVLAAADGSPITGAVVDIMDAGLRAWTDEDGRYSFSRLPRGNRTFRVAAVGFQLHTQVLVVPGRTEDYVFELASL